MFRIAVTLIVLLFARFAAAQMTGAPTTGYKLEAGTSASALPAQLREIGFDQNLDQQIPSDIPFTDEYGRQVVLGRYFSDRPVVLVFMYYDCPLLCPQVLNALGSSLDVLSMQPGKDFEVVIVSFDSRETPKVASAKKSLFLQRYKKAGADAASHFLTGDAAAIARAAKAAGFRFVWDDRLQQFAHPTGVIVVTPHGRVARYLFGIEYGPRDLRLALVDAASGRIGTAVDSFLLYCYHYDPMTGRYGLVIMRVIRVAAIGTVVTLALFIGIMLRRERAAHRVDGTPNTASHHPARGNP